MANRVPTAAEAEAAAEVVTAAAVAESKLALAAEAQLTKLDGLVKTATDSALKPWKKAVRWLTGLVVAFAIGTGVMGVLYAQEYSTTQQVSALAHANQQAALSGCLAANSRAAADRGNWDLFLDILLKGNTNAYDLHEESVIKSHVAQVDAPRDCIKAYSGS
jgi:hypothetical protein